MGIIMCVFCRFCYGYSDGVRGTIVFVELRVNAFMLAYVYVHTHTHTHTNPDAPPPRGSFSGGPDRAEAHY